MGTKRDIPQLHQLYSEQERLISATPLLTVDEEQVLALDSSK